MFTKMDRKLLTHRDSLLKETKMCIGRFFYENGLDFRAVNSPSFRKMIALMSGRGMEYQVPTIEELKGWIFKDVMREMHERVEEIRQSWSETGCSILLDGWTDANGRSLVNVIVDCPRGTVYLRSSDITDCVGNMDAMQSFLVAVVAEVGNQHVVQIIVNSLSTFMKEAGRLLMERYRPIYWTVSATFCIEVMLEKIRAMDVVNETLEKAEIITGFIHSHPVVARKYQLPEDSYTKTRSIRPFVTLENMVMVKETLNQMFFSTHPQSSIINSNDTEGRRVGELVGDVSFWSGASTVLIGATPLVRVIEWLDKSGKDHMEYIYEAIHEAKEMIREGFGDRRSAYSPFWDVIDDVWKEFLYSPLHSTAYYLNPRSVSYSYPCCSAEVVTGLCCCIVRSTEDRCRQDRLTVQTERYKIAIASTAGESEHQRSTLPPAIWWWRYGGEWPELQRLGVRILSQTCDGAAKFELKRSLAEIVAVSKGRSESESDQKWVRERDMVFVRYNMQLQNFEPGRSRNSDEVDHWIADKLSNDSVTPKYLDNGMQLQRRGVNGWVKPGPDLLTHATGPDPDPLVSLGPGLGSLQPITHADADPSRRKSKRKIKLPIRLKNFIID